MRLDPLVSIALQVSFGALFGFAVLHKLTHFHIFLLTLRKYLQDTALGGSGATVTIAAIVVLVEIVLVVTCALPSDRIVAGIATAIVLLGYALAMYANLRRDNLLLDCGCTWGHRQPVSAALVLRNVCLALLALVSALPVVTRPLSAIDLISIGAASCIGATLYTGFNLLLAVAAGRQEAR